MRKKEAYTIITPIPSSVPRQLAIDILHSHSEIITLNPLVLSHHPVRAPRNASADEYYSTWYEITERVQYVPGLGMMGSGKIRFKGCFHNVSWGLQTHMYAPMGIDIRSKWHIAGNQPDELPESRKLRLDGVPENGLYLREDIEIECNLTLMSFVKTQLKVASKVLVDRLIKKAELLDAGVLQAMMEHGKLKTFNPADRSSTIPLQSPPQSPRMSMSSTEPTRWGSVSSRSRTNFSFSPPQYGQEHNRSMAVELPSDCYHSLPLNGSEKPNELSGIASSRYFEFGCLSSSQPLSDTSLKPGKGYPVELSAIKGSSEEHSETRNVVHEMF